MSSRLDVAREKIENNIGSVQVPITELEVSCGTHVEFQFKLLLIILHNGKASF